MIVKVEMFLDIEDDFAEDIKKIEHHAECFLNLEDNPEICSVFGVKVTTED